MSIGVNEESKGLDSSAPGLALVKVEPGRYFLQLSIWFRNFNQQVCYPKPKRHPELQKLKKSEFR